ncbi:Glycosyl transferase group 1 [Magnetospirillum molischianum DSM 120]|uniref:Glycosyl transferase group 1 n=2 Tax=Magnetospirillum molischianum TaxID=1083 RepID=H8FXG4_MAGML|nr:Glycosyl transferase group 1 [Magnetospirillum molischianum DSM 120]
MGGAERVLTTMANHWAAEGRQVILFRFDSSDTRPYQRLDARVTERPLDLLKHSTGLLSGIANNLRRIRTLRRALKQARPQAVIAFIDQTNVVTLAATLGTGFPVIVSERGHPIDQPISRLWNALRRLLYPTAYALVMPTRRGLECFPELILRLGRVIPNPVVSHIPHVSTYDGPTIVAAGRLVALKGFDLLIRAFARVAPHHVGWRLCIWGDGPERKTLAPLVADLGMTNRVSLPGISQQPGEWIHGAGLFALTSRSEGFPNVLLEAMNAGLPVIATDCPTGPAELIDDGVNGVLVPVDDIDRLAEELDRLMGDAALRDRLGKEAAKTAEAYSIDSIMAQWSQLIDEAVARPSRKD